MKFIKILGLLSLLALLLVACDSDNNEPIAQLPQTMVDTTGTMQVSYPDGWLVNTGEVRISLSNYPEAFTTGEDLTTGQVSGTITLIRADLINTLELEPSPSPRDVLDGVVDRNNNNLDIDIDARNEYTFGNYQAYIMRGTTDNNGLTTGFINAVVKTSGGYVLFNFNVVADETEQFYDQIRQITTTLVYPVPSDG